MIPTPPLFPNTQVGRGKCETTAHSKGRRGTSRNATEPDGTPKFGYSALVSAIFWWIFSKLSNIFCFRRPPFPNTQVGKGGSETTDQTKGRCGTPRNVTEPDGTPKFGYAALESTKFWRIFSKCSNILCFQRTLFQTPKLRKGAKRDSTGQTKGRRGTPRNAAERLNMAIPHCGPPYFDGCPPNCQIFYASDAPFAQHPRRRRGRCETTDQTKGRRGTPRNVTERYGT